MVILLVGCSNGDHRFTYDYLSFKGDNIQIWPSEIAVDSKDMVENGEYEFKDGEGNSICKGVFDYGLKSGRWIYEEGKNNTIEIDWAKYKKADIKINYPESWKIHEDPKRPFQATFPLKANENSKKKYFMILTYNKDSIGKDLEQFKRYYDKKVSRIEKMKEYSRFFMGTLSEKKFYYSKYVLERETGEYLIFSFLGELNSNIYDVVYSSLNEESEKKQIIFFEMIRSLDLNGQRFFSPFDHIDVVKDLDAK